MKKLAAAALVWLLSGAVHAGPPGLLAPGAEPDCAQSDFFDRFYEPKAANVAWKKVLHKHYHPFEFELLNGVGTENVDPALSKELMDSTKGLGRKASLAAAESKKAAPNKAVIEAFIKDLRPRLVAASQAQLSKSAAPLPTTQLSTFDSRLAACRMSHIGKRAALDDALAAASKTPKQSADALVYWTAFSRLELQAYISDAKPADGKPIAEYKALWGTMASRAADALKNAGSPAEQQKAIAAAKFAGPPYVVSVSSDVVPPPVLKPAVTAGPVIGLTKEEHQALPDKIQADYLADRAQILEANKGKKPEEIAAAIKPMLDRYREIGALRARMPPEHRKQYDAKINATASSNRQARDQITAEYGKSFSPKKQLAKTEVDGADCTMDGNCKKPNLVVASGPGSGKPDGRSKEEIARDEEAARLEREKREAEKNGRGKTGVVPTPAGSGVTKDDGGKDPDKPKPDANRDVINGAKLGLWGAILGFLTMGPIGMLFLGAICMGVGTLMSKEANK